MYESATINLYANTLHLPFSRDILQSKALLLFPAVVASYPCRTYIRVVYHWEYRLSIHALKKHIMCMSGWWKWIWEIYTCTGYVLHQQQLRLHTWVCSVVNLSIHWIRLRKLFVCASTITFLPRFKSGKICEFHNGFVRSKVSCRDSVHGNKCWGISLYLRSLPCQCMWASVMGGGWSPKPDRQVCTWFSPNIVANSGLESPSNAPYLKIIDHR
jgi:hypothetical protein